MTFSMSAASRTVRRPIPQTGKVVSGRELFRLRFGRCADGHHIDVNPARPVTDKCDHFSIRRDDDLAVPSRWREPALIVILPERSRLASERRHFDLADLSLIGAFGPDEGLLRRELHRSRIPRDSGPCDIASVNGDDTYSAFDRPLRRIPVRGSRRPSVTVLNHPHPVAIEGHEYTDGWIGWAAAVTAASPSSATAAVPSALGSVSVFGAPAVNAIH